MIYLSIGSNQGNRLDNIRKAIKLLKDRLFPSLKESIILETKAILPPDAPPHWDYPHLNMIVYGYSIESPDNLLLGLKQIEQEVGRAKNYDHWSPRIIDLDILLWDQKVISSDNLTIPHSELLNRPFFLHLLGLLDEKLVYQVKGHEYYGKTFQAIAREVVNIDKCFLNSFVLNPSFVGVVNITPDSFSDGGEFFQPAKAIEQINQLNAGGASIIELGAQSTRPGATYINAEEEWQRLQPVLELLAMDREQAWQISVDSFHPEIIEKLLQYNFIKWINDVKGEFETELLKKIAETGISIAIMHSLGIPPDAKNIINENHAAIDTLYSWAKEKIKELKDCGFSEEHIIIDPGIGFGKSIYQNINLLREANKLKELGCKVLIGHSRKSFMKGFSNLLPSERDLETIAVSEILHSQEIDYLRVHNVSGHQRFFVTKQVIGK